MASGTIKTGAETQTGTLGSLGGGQIYYFWDKTHHIGSIYWGAGGTAATKGIHSFPYPTGLAIPTRMEYVSRNGIVCSLNTATFVFSNGSGSSGEWDFFTAVFPTV